ncbi:MAG: sigma-70 family RNA polymerase sigma factor [Bacteroidales bacterium]|nr:sigma-70 family RNA polymerase sigma factor [Bacteroidales bacterium]
MKKESIKPVLSDEESQAQRLASFEANVTVYCKRLYNFLYGLCRDEELSKDLLQDTMLRAQHQFMQGFYSEKGLVWCWLRTIAQNILYKHYRIQNRERLKNEEERQLICDNLGWNSLSVEPAPVESDLSPRIDRQQTKDLLSDHMPLLIQSDFRFFKLNAQERALVSGRHLQMKSFKELACMTGEAISTVMSRYYTAMKKMQRQLVDWESHGLFQEELSLQSLQKMQQREMEEAERRKKHRNLVRRKPGRPRKDAADGGITTGI